MMKTTEIKQKFLEGNKQAIRKLIAKKQKDGSSLIVSENGKIKKLLATEIQ
jgi:predicted Mrr-cat superfamily restriction endonuclease